MELRHLRYFIAVAEEGSLTNAAERRLHTAQPSLSRQIRDLESEVGVRLFQREARGVSLTPAGQVFLGHARVALMQIDAACEAARHAGRPGPRPFVVGFLAGQEVVWLSEILRILREEAPDGEITLTTASSPELTNGLVEGRVDLALLRQEEQTAGLGFKLLAKEPLIAILPIGHLLAAQSEVSPQELARETFISTARIAPVLRRLVEDYAADVGVVLRQEYDAETISGGMSLVASTGCFTLVPLYVQQMLIPAVIARPLAGKMPTIDLMLGYNTSNASPLLKRFLTRADELVERGSYKQALLMRLNAG